jgi:Carboxypeptidase regulatory-like domain
MQQIRWFAGLIAIACLGGLATAQTPTGTMQGSITDSTGAAIPAATVTVSNNATNESHSATSDPSGRFILPFVAPGTYSVTVDAKGFRSERQESVVVDVAQTRAVDFVMPVGTASETVQVTATTQALDVDSSSVGETIQSNQILDLPDNGRNPFDFALLVPAVNNTGNASTPHIGGSRNGNNEQLIDGMTNILPENNVGNNESAYTPIIDSVQEVNVQTSVLPAEYGRFSGGTISLITKGGTNQLHGTFYEFAEDTPLNALPFGSSSTSVKPNAYRYQTGATVGGPIVLPRLYDGHNKSFFFFDFEDSRQSNGAANHYTVPNKNWLTGDFSDIPGQIYNPYSVHQVTNPDGSTSYVRDPFPGNIIPASLLTSPGSKIAQAALAYYPAPNVPGATPESTGNFLQVGSSLNNYWHYDARGDQDVTKKWHAFLRFSQFSNDSAPLNDYNNAASPGGYNGPAHSSALSGSFNNTVNFTPTLLGEFRYGYSKAKVLRTPFPSKGFTLTSLGFPQSVADQAEGGLSTVFPSFSFSNSFSDLGTDGYVALKENPVAQDVNGSLVKILGGHSLKFGGEYRELLLDFYQYAYPTGTFSSNTSWTQLSPQNNNGTGNPIASLLLGLPNSGNQPNEPSVVSTSGYMAFYIQDDWKVTPRLTVNAGVRWDAEIPRVEKFNQLSYWNANATSPLQGLVPSSAGCPNCSSLKGQMVLVGRAGAQYGRHQAPTNWKDWGPRLGAAWNPTPKLVVRSGFGLVFQPSALQAAGTSGAPGIEGFTSQTNLATSFNNQQTAPTFDLSNPYPSGFNLPQGKNPACLAVATCVQAIDVGTGIGQSYFDSHRSPYTIQWNGNVQYAFPGNLILELGYLGNRGIYLINGDPGKPYDQLPTSYLSQGAALQNTQVANPFYGVITTPGSDLAQPMIQASKLLRKWPEYDGVMSFRKPGASSTFNAFTIRANKQLSNGLAFTLSFTDGREYDNSAAAVTYLGPVSSTYADQYNPKGEWAIGAQNVNYQIVSSAIYELPFGHGKAYLNSAGKGANLLVNGWQVAGIENWSTGNPVVLNTFDNGTTAETIFTLGQRPAWNGKSSSSGTAPFTKFDWQDFAKPAPYTIGNAPRALGWVHNPDSQNFDFSLTKNTKFGDRYNVQIRMEMFNALNHPNLGSVDSNFGDQSFDSNGNRTGGNFGSVPTGSFSNSSRQIQLAAKFYY